MDLRVYYRSVRETEASLPAPEVVVVSLKTEDGGAAGVCSEVRRPVAAKLIVDQRARVATEEEAAEFRQRQAEERQAASQAAQAGRMQVTVISEADLRALRKSAKG